MSSMENARLSEIYDFQYGTGNNNPDNGGVYPVYGSNGIIGGYSKYNSEDSPVIGHIGANCGAVVFGKGKHFVTYNGVICKIKKGVDPQFGYYVLLASNLKRLGFGSAQPFISYGTLKRVAIYKPNYDIQVKLGRILSNYDHLIENNNKRIKLLEQKAEELYKEWFVRFRFPGHENTYVENAIPNGWKYVNLFEIGNVIYGFPFDSSKFCDDDSLNPVVRIRDIPGNNTFTYTSEVCDSKYIIKKNDILVGMDGIFHMCLWNGEYALLNQRVVKINSKKKDFSELLLYLSIYDQIKFWEATLCGTTVSHLGDKHLKRMKVLLPPKEVLVKTNNIFTNIMNEKANLLAKNKKLIKQRDALLPRLMSGKLSVEGKEVI